jgi:putative oxidoreductase
MKNVLNKFKMGLFIFYGLLMINGGMNKFFNYMPVPEDIPESTKTFMAAIESMIWLFPLVAVAEITGGILSLFNRTRALASLVLFPVVIGILLTHLFQDPATLPIAIVILVVNTWMMIDNRSKLTHLISK